MKVIESSEYPYAVCDECMHLIKPGAGMLIGEGSFRIYNDCRQIILCSYCLTKALKMWSEWESKSR